MSAVCSSRERALGLSMLENRAERSSKNLRQKRLVGSFGHIHSSVAPTLNHCSAVHFPPSNKLKSDHLSHQGDLWNLHFVFALIKLQGSKETFQTNLQPLLKKNTKQRRKKVSLNTGRVNHTRNVEQVHSEEEINVRWPWGRHFFNSHWYVLSILPLLPSLRCFNHDKIAHHCNCCTAMASIWMNNFQTLKKFKMKNYLKEVWFSSQSVTLNPDPTELLAHMFGVSKRFWQQDDASGKINDGVCAVL